MRTRHWAHSVLNKHLCAISLHVLSPQSHCSIVFIGWLNQVQQPYLSCQRLIKGFSQVNHHEICPQNIQWRSAQNNKDELEGRERVEDIVQSVFKLM